MLNLGITEYLRYQKLAIFFAVFHLLLLLFLLSMNIDLVKRPMGIMWLMVVEVAAMALGLIQMLAHKRRGHWVYLLHRPLSTPKILVSLIAAGSCLLIIALLIPYLLLLIYMDNIGVYGIEFRHYTALSIATMAIISSYLIACFVSLSPHRLSIVSLLFFFLFTVNFTNIRIYSSSLLILCCSLGIVFVSFKPDLLAPAKRASQIWLAELPIQSALYLLLLAMLSTVLEFSPDNPVANPVANSAYAIARQPSDEIMLSALEGSLHPESDFIRQQVRIGEVTDVLNPGGISYPLRNQRAGLDNNLTLRDGDSNEIWIFSHSMMLYEGVNTALGERVGWLGPEGFSGTDSISDMRFSSVPWVTENEYVINASAIFQLDWDSRRLLKRFELIEEGGAIQAERFSDSLNLTENVTTLVSNQNLYLFRTVDVRDIDAELTLRTKLSLKSNGESANRRPYGKQMYVMELIDGYLVSIISNIPQRFSTLIDFGLYGQAELSLYKTNESGVNELIHQRALADTYSFAYLSKGFIVSPGIWLTTSFFNALYIDNPARKWSSLYADIPMLALLFAGLANIISALLVFVLLRKTRLSKTARCSWLVLTAFTGMLGLLSFWLGTYWRKLKVSDTQGEELTMHRSGA